MEVELVPFAGAPWSLDVPAGCLVVHEREGCRVPEVEMLDSHVVLEVDVHRPGADVVDARREPQALGVVRLLDRVARHRRRARLVEPVVRGAGLLAAGCGEAKLPGEPWNE